MDRERPGDMQADRPMARQTHKPRRSDCDNTGSGDTDRCRSMDRERPEYVQADRPTARQTDKHRSSDSKRQRINSGERKGRTRLIHRRSNSPITDWSRKGTVQSHSQRSHSRSSIERRESSSPIRSTKQSRSSVQSGKSHSLRKLKEGVPHTSMISTSESDEAEVQETIQLVEAKTAKGIIFRLSYLFNEVQHIKGLSPFDFRSLIQGQADIAQCRGDWKWVNETRLFALTYALDNAWVNAVLPTRSGNDFKREFTPIQNDPDRDYVTPLSPEYEVQGYMAPLSPDYEGHGSVTPPLPDYPCHGSVTPLFPDDQGQDYEAPYFQNYQVHDSVATLFPDDQGQDYEAPHFQDYQVHDSEATLFPDYQG